MKYLKVFETETLQNEFRSSQDYIEPHVSCLINGENVKYNKSLEQLKVPFTIEATQDGTEIYFRQSSYAVDEGLDPLKVEISTDGGVTWTEKTAHVQYEDELLAELDEGDKVLIRGKNEAYGYYSSENFNEWADNCNFWADRPCYVYGNIMSLIGGNDFARLRKVNQGTFAWFFSDYNEALDWSWVLLKEGQELILPATTLANSCYYCMFYCCSSLTSATDLPATTLADHCYDGMFYRCTSLTTAPTLSATTLANYCCNAMFYDCTSLTVAPALPAMTLASYCYSYMFYNCTGLTSVPELPATTLADHCYDGMFCNCTNLSYIKAMFTTTPGSSYTSGWVDNVKGTGTFVKNSAATWNVTGANGIPTGWTIETASSSNEEFVGILIASGNNKSLYIKSSELSDFVGMNTGVNVYVNQECTTPYMPDGGAETWDIATSGLEAYYEANNIEMGELPGVSEFTVNNGKIIEYVEVEEQPLE